MQDPTGRYYNIFLGCIAGGAFGDALGFPVEFMQLSEIVAQYGRNGITALEPGPNGTAMISDDTQMTLFTMDGLTTGMNRVKQHRTDSPAEVYIDRAYLDWYATQHSRLHYSRPFTAIYQDRRLHAQRAPGNTNLSALAEQFRNPRDPRDEFDVGARGTIQRPLNASKGCGAVMRSAPIGLMLNNENYHLQTESVAEVSARAAAITHGDPMGWLPAALLSEIINRMTYRRPADPTLERLMGNALYQVEQRFRGTKGMDELVALIEKAMQWAGDRTRKTGTCLAGLGQGWTGDSAIATGIFLTLRYQNDYFRAVHAAVNRSGDSDSAGSITGNLLGAWLGYEAVANQLNAIYRVPYYMETHLEMFDLIRETVNRAYQIAVLGQ